MTDAAELHLATLVAHRAAQDPDFNVLTIEGGGVRPDEIRTYRTLWDNGQRMAQAMLALGLEPGERIALLMANHAEFVEAMVAASVLGAVVVPIDPRTRGDKLHFMLHHAQCSAAFIADYTLEHLSPLRASLPNLRWVMGLVTDEGSEPLSNHAWVEDWAATPAATHDLPIRTKDPDSALELIFTSGTTGDPKGIVMTHRRYCETSLLAKRLFGYNDDDTLYSGLSLTHANAQIITLGAALACRLRCVLSRRFSKSRLWDIARQHGATSFTLLGGMTTAVYAQQPCPDDADHPVRMVVSAGMPAAIWSAFEQRFGVKILEFYGAAEGGLTINPPGLGPVGSIGKPAPTLQYRIVDEHDQDVAAGTPGELWFQHANGAPLQVAYHDNEAASHKKCEGGWLRMGDVVHADAQGWLFFHYRKGGGIRRNGEFINASSVEKAIADSGLVDDVFVYGVPSANQASGEKDVVAAVVPKSATSLDVTALIQVCRKQLEPNAIPSFIQVLAQIPKTASEKPLERHLMAAFESMPDTVHHIDKPAR